MKVLHVRTNVDHVKPYYWTERSDWVPTRLSSKWRVGIYLVV